MQIKPKIKRILLIVTGSVLLAITVIILLLSPIEKYLVEKYVGRYLGRQIQMSWIYINPFTGFVHISNLRIYESKIQASYHQGDSIFLSAKGVSANFALLKLLSKTIEISEISLDQPRGIIIQKKRELNFTDLIKLFTPKKPRTAPAKFHFNILQIRIINGEFHYREEVTPIVYFIKEVSIESTGKRWNSDTMGVSYSFHSGPGSGSVKGNFTINFKTMGYRFAAIADSFDLKVMDQYLKELINYGSFRANLDADVKATGNFKDQENLNLEGMVAVNDFHFGKNPSEDFASFDKLVLKIDELSPRDHEYIFDSVSIIHPFFKYERYDYLDNLQMMFGKNGSNISAAYADPSHFNLILKIADYIKVLVKNFLQSYYKINRLAIYRADFRYNDFAISEKFSAGLNPLFLVADSIDKNHKRLNVTLKSGIQPYGNIAVTLSINPKNNEDFDLQYHLRHIAASMFNPYLISYTSYPLDRGTIELNGSWNVRDANIQSVNHLLIIDPLVTKRRVNKNASWIPTALIMFFVRERGNVIDYEIPITGNLKSPTFHLHDVLVDILENIFVKPATTAYREEVKELETEIEKSLTLKWGTRQTTLSPEQETFVNKMVEFLKKNPDATIAVYPMDYAEKEKEYIGFFEAKKKYFLSVRNNNALMLSEADSLKVDKMSVKDTVFVQYLNKHDNNAMLFTIQDKCNKYIGATMVNDKFKQLNKEREDVFLSYFKKKGIENRIKIHTGENTIPYNGFSFYKIVYNGEFPASLIKAYQKMNGFNHEAPRKKYQKEREKNKHVL